MLRRFPKLTVSENAVNNDLQAKIQDILNKYTSLDASLECHLQEVIAVAIACGKTKEALGELEAHWDSYLNRYWSAICGSDPTHFMLYSLGERLGIAYF
jgi:hypothetical protein